VLLPAAQVSLYLRGRPAVRFMRLLHQAADKQVLRQAGAVYQFRHAELQNHLASLYRSGALTGRRP
jgi:hypothetical protein